MICAKHNVPFDPPCRVHIPGRSSRTKMSPRGAACPECLREMRERVKAAKAIHRKYHVSRGLPRRAPAPTVMMPRD